MLHRFSPARALRPLALFAAALVALPGLAETHLLVMGGGSRPSSNQVSLEKNVNYFYRVIKRLGLDTAQRDIMFACGDDPGQADVQYIATASDDPQVMRLIDMLVGPGKGQSKQYRAHDIGGGEIASSKPHIVKWFDEHADQLGQDDKLLLYFTGHGGRGEKTNDQNTTLYLWPNHNIRMTDFTGELDKLDPQTPVVMVMVQCFSGGFANVIFNEGDPDKGLAEHNRCGFFAAVHSRPAAGCTAHVNEADYKEYSSYFWAALSGEDRLGVPVDRPDYDGDGKTSYLEAHAFALIYSDSTDLSMTTTDRLVRAIKIEALSPKTQDKQDASEGQGESEKGDAEQAESEQAESEQTSAKDTDPPHGLLSQHSAYPDLLAVADPARRAVLEGLSERLNLTGDDRVAQARAALDQAKRDRSSLYAQKRDLGRALASTRKPLVETITERWPRLADPKSEEAIAAILENADAIRQAIADEEGYTKLSEQLNELEAIDAKNEALTASIAHVERFLYTCESVAKIDALLRFGTPDQVEAYQRLLAREMALPTP